MYIYIYIQKNKPKAIILKNTLIIIQLLRIFFYVYFYIKFY